MLAGQRPSDCGKCWRNEDAGTVSDRQLKNQILSLIEDTTIQSLLGQCLNDQYSVKMLKIDTSNTCNATCVTCGSESSSSWAVLEKKHNITPKNNWRIQHNVFEHKLDYPNLKAVSFLGFSIKFSITSEISKAFLTKSKMENFLNWETSIKTRKMSSWLN